MIGNMSILLSIFTLAVCLAYIVMAAKKPAIALVTAPISSLVFFVLGQNNDNLLVCVLAVMFIPATLLVLSLERIKSHQTAWPHAIAKWIIICIILIVVIVLPFIVIGPNFSFGFIFAILLVGSIISYNVISKQAATLEIISTIKTSMHQNLPLSMALSSASRGANYKCALVLNQISHWLTQGYSLSESIKKGYPRCPGYVLGMIGMAEKVNQVPFAIECLEKDILEKHFNRTTVRPVYPAYPIFMISMTLFIVMGIMYFVIPKFEEVFNDFDVELPQSTQSLMAICNTSVEWLLGFLLFIVFVLIPLWSYTRFRPRNPQKPRMISRLGDFLKWHLPLVRWFEKTYSFIHMLEYLRLSLISGCSINNCIEYTLGLDLNHCYKRMLKKWLQRVEKGEDVALAAQQSGLPPSLSWAFDSKINQNQTPQILHILEDHLRIHYNYLANLSRYIFWPMIILGMGLIVGFIVYAIFTPLITLIQHLTIIP